MANFGVDERARDLLKETWPMIAPCLEPAIDDVLAAAKFVPHIAPIVARNKDLLKRLELAHYEAFLGGRLDSDYADSCRRTVEQEAALGLDSRMRSNAGNYVFRAALAAIARKHRFSSRKALERAAVISQLIALDVTNAMALHREAADQAAARRKVIDAAIADFANAIGVVVGAIKEASASLSTTCGTMKQVADDAFSRMASA
ncbi:MAG TPA: protoglobin domain-containing protein [Xanthobacteraceae bacterium]